MDGADAALLASLDGKLEQVRDRVRGVAVGLHRAAYVWGPGGVGKTTAVEEVLSACGRACRLTNSRVTGRGLFDLFAQDPDAVHVLDDVESILTDPQAVGVLRAALDTKAERIVTWVTSGKDGPREVAFTGGVVMLGNTELRRGSGGGLSGPLAALANRVDPVLFDPTPDELAAMMRRLAAGGFERGRYRLAPEACREVADAVVRLSAGASRPLDLRLYVNGCLDRVQFDAGLSSTHWLDLLDGRTRQRVNAPALPTADVRPMDVIAAIAHLPKPERVAVWKEYTGLSQAAMYRWANRLRGGENSHPEGN